MIIPIVSSPALWWAFWIGSRRHEGEGFVTYGERAWPSYSTLIVF